jgi:hypothetical protein
VRWLAVMGFPYGSDARVLEVLRGMMKSGVAHLGRR